MLILASTSDLLRINVGSAGLFDVHVSWMDNVAGAVGPGRTNTPNIAASGLTTIVAAPAAGVFRAIKALHIFNRGTAPNTVTVVHSDGTTTVELHRAVVQPDTALQYIDEVGFFVSSSAPSGSYVLIERKEVVPAAPVADVQFVKGIDSAFDEFEFRIYNWQAASTAHPFLQVFDGTTWRNDPLYSWAWSAVNVNNQASGFMSANYSVSGQLQLASEIGAGAFNNYMRLSLAQPWKPNATVIQGDVSLYTPGAGIGRWAWSASYSSGIPISGVRFYLQTVPGVVNINTSSGIFNLYGVQR